MATMLLDREHIDVWTTETINIIKMVWDYLGPPIEEYDFILDRKHQRLKSVVRYIGSRLPLAPCKRAYFALISTVVSEAEHLRRLRLQNPKFINDEFLIGPPCPTLDDFDWLMDESQLNMGIYTRLSLRLYYSQGSDVTDPLTPISTPPNNGLLHQSLNFTPILSSTALFTPSNGTHQNTSSGMADTVAMLKISALEDELAKLRAQIATIVSISPAEPGPVTPPVPVVHPTVPPCAPPPPPPPPPPMLVSTPVNVIDVIKMNRKKTGSSYKEFLNENKKGDIPDMKSVLRGLSSVKLKQIARSPGGTPLHSKQKPVNPRDPAAIIAQALKRKFARTVNDSPIRSWGNSSPRSPMDSPSEWDKENFTPPFGQHILRRTTYYSRQDIIN